MADLPTELPPLSARLAGILSGLDVHYPSPDPDAHSLVGQRVPDLPTTSGNLFGQLGDGRPLLLDFSGSGVVTPAGIRVAAANDPWPGHEELAAVLVRPDGYVWSAVDNAVTEAVVALPVRFAA